MSKGFRMKLICPNKDCINKSIVYRQFDILKEHRCKACNSQLVKAHDRQHEQRRLNAKIDYERLNNDLR